MGKPMGFRHEFITKSNLKNMLSSAGFSDTSNDKYEKNIHFLIQCH